MKWPWHRRANGPKWLDGYTGQSTDELIRLEGTYRTDSIVLAFEQGVSQKAIGVGLDGLSEPERVILAVEAVEREVNNGGFDQLFRNESRLLAAYLEASLRAIDRPDVAAIAGRAFKALKLRAPITSDAIDAAMSEADERRDARLEKCDAAYFEIAGDLAGPLFAYIKVKRSEIELVVASS